MSVRRRFLLHWLLLLALFFAGARSAPAALGLVGEWVQFPKLASDSFVSHIITSIDRDASKRLWVGTDRGLVWTADEGGTWNPVNLAFALPLKPRADLPPQPTGRALVGEPLIRRNSVTSVSAGRNGVWVGTMNGLCFGGDDLKSWTLFSPETDGPGPEIWAVAEYMGEVWASSASGLFKSNNGGTRWEKIQGAFPSFISSITVADTPNGRTVWLAGFDAPFRYGGGPDLLCSGDGGRTWRAVKTGTASAIAQPVSSRVHRVALIDGVLWACTRHGVTRSADWGESWTRIKGKAGVETDEIFDILAWEEGLWITTREGLYVSRDKGETWVHDSRLRCPVRTGIPGARRLWLATEGGLLARSHAGEWQSYSTSSNALCMAITREDGVDVWWVGTTGGLARSRDGGQTWRVLTVADGLPSNLILCLAADGDRVWAGTDGGAWLATKGGEGGRRFGKETGLRGLIIRQILVGPKDVWAATDHGLGWLPHKQTEWRVIQSNKEWRAICYAQGVMYGVVVDNFDPRAEMRVVCGKPETDKWQTLQVQGRENLRIHQVLDVGEDLWLASDEGLYRTRDGGATWAKFASETLWATRVTRMCRGPDNMLCVQSAPTDPPSLMAFLNVTRDGGRSWSVLAAPLPGQVQELMVKGDRLMIGTAEAQFGANLLRGTVAAYDGFERDLRPARNSWFAWNRIAAFAASTYRPDQLGITSLVDRYALHGPTLWFGSRGAGAISKDVPLLDPGRRAWNLDRTPASVESFAKLTGEEVLALADAPEGLWFGTARGLYFYDRRESMNSWRPSAQQLLSVPVRALVVARGLVWIGTDTGLNTFDPATGAWRTLRTDNSALPDDRITCLGYDGKTVWGGTLHGAFRVDEDGLLRTLPPPMAEERVTDLALGEEREYFATDRGMRSLDRDGITRSHLQRDNSPLDDNDVLRVFIDGPDLWAATQKGVTKVLHDAAEPSAPAETESSLRGPEGVLVVVNDQSVESGLVGEEYAKARKIPEVNICRINCPTQETISRTLYNRDVRDAIRDYLFAKGLTRKISFIVTTRGIPLRIAPEPGGPMDGVARAEASVDSELALLGREYSVEGAVPNPYLHRDQPFNSDAFGMYLVTRLDGPTLNAIAGLYKDAISVEEERSLGSRGFARFDLYPLEDKMADRINAGILRNYKLLSRQERLFGRVAPAERTLLPFFRVGSAYNTFFYLGWGAYEYRPEVFFWVRGAIAVDLDPMSAATLHQASGSWAAGAVAAGVTATMGTVYDPAPFETLSVDNLYRYAKAGYTWAEIAYMSIENLSWQAVVVGDPLYTPMK